MREILFCGKRMDNGEWVEGFYMALGEKYHYILTGILDCSYGFPDLVKHPVDPATVGQYTGLTANGKKIFEGNILQLDYIGENKGVHGRAAVCFENGKFGVLWGYHKEFVTLDGFANTTLEVIGNIHDNPELLEEDNGT